MATPASRSYFKALRLFKKKQWNKAQLEFTNTLRLVKKLPTRTSKQKLFFNLGYSDIKYHLALIQQKLGKKELACFQFKKLVKRISFIKKKWPRWRRQRINLLLPGRFRDAKRRFARCQKVPTTVTLTGVPSNAKIFLFQPNRNHPQKGTWVSISPTFTTFRKQVKIRIVSKDYKDKEQVISVKQWHTDPTPVQLKKKPKPKPRKRKIIHIPRERIIKPPPRRIIKPPTPLYKKPWLWVVVGGVVVAAGVGITVAVLASQQTPQSFIPKIPKGSGSGSPFPTVPQDQSSNTVKNKENGS